MRRIITLLAVVGVIMAGIALPASADPPVEFSFSATAADTDPCTGEAITVDLVFSVKAHDHPNNIVWIIDSYGETSNGYVGNGHEIQVTNRNHWISVFNWQVVNDDTGARYTIKGHFMIDLDTGDAQFESVELTCVGQPA